MIKQILNEENAVKEVLQILKKDFDYEWQNINYINQNRYAIIQGKPNAAILLKREVFHNFGKKFRDKGMQGVGDSINIKHLQVFANKNVKMIYTLFPDGKLYYISLQEFLMCSYPWVQKEGTPVRSISIHSYKRFN